MKKIVIRLVCCLALLYSKVDGMWDLFASRSIMTGLLGLL